MGFFSSLKRLFFATESVAKSAGEKTVDLAKEKGEEFMDKTKEFASETGKKVNDKTSGLRDAIEHSAEDFIDKAKEVAEDLTEKAEDFIEDVNESEFVKKSKEKITGFTDSVKERTSEFNKENLADIPDDHEVKNKMDETLEDISEKSKEFVGKAKAKMSEIADEIGENENVKKAADFTEKVGDKVLDSGEAFMEKAKEISENVGKKVLDQGDEALEKGEDLSEKVGKKVLQAKDEIVERAKKITEDLGEKFDETMEKAEKMAAEEAAKPKQEFSDKTLDAGGSLLDGTDDFFAKAAKFAEGDYDAVNEGKITVSETKANIETKPISKAAGFEDLDGDGNEIIDDAIIDEEE